MPIRLEPRVIAKTADYTVNTHVDRCGTVFTNRGAAGAVNFTLPTVAANQRIGLYYDFMVVVDQTVGIVAPVADTLVAFNDIAADSVAFSTAGQKVGASLRAMWDGTQWSAINRSTNTLTVTT